DRLGGVAGDSGGVNALLYLSFFFQAEDGIRDATVTGVQTCALPISVKLYHSSRDYMNRYTPGHLGLDLADFWRQMERCFADLLRSEERRVGKERRCLRRPGHSKDKEGRRVAEVHTHVRRRGRRAQHA